MRVSTPLSIYSSALLAIAGICLASSICHNSPNDTIPDGCATYGSLDELNKVIRPLVQDITRDTDYFSYYRLDLYGRTCPFWSDNAGMCANIACAVNTINNEDDIPPIWRAAELSKLAGPRARHPPAEEVVAAPSPLGGALGEDTAESCVVERDECDERDYCVPEDESHGSTGDYVSLIENPERFTGYAGAGAENVWKSIYRENCFSDQRKENPTETKRSPAARDFASVMQNRLGKSAIEDPNMLQIGADKECLEKRVFYRIISGMHASISMHLCWDHLNQTTGHWGPNLNCFIERFQNHPDRLRNIYFNYAVLLRAISKLRNYLPKYTFCSGDYTQNRLTKAKVLKLVNAIPSGKAVFDETVMFREDAAVLKEDFRNRFRNVSRLMDCVGCDKCRLWGKVQTQGYGTALKVLFEFDENADISANPPLRRTELVALINTSDRISHSLDVISKFQDLWEERNRTTAEIPTAASQDKKVLIEGNEEPSEGGEENDESYSSIFWKEWYAVWETFHFVTMSWVHLPQIFYKVFLQLASEFWDRLFGLQSQPLFFQWRSQPHTGDTKSEL